MLSSSSWRPIAPVAHRTKQNRRPRFVKGRESINMAWLCLGKAAAVVDPFEQESAKLKLTNSGGKKPHQVKHQDLPGTPVHNTWIDLFGHSAPGQCKSSTGRSNHGDVVRPPDNKAHAPRLKRRPTWTALGVTLPPRPTALCRPDATPRGFPCLNPRLPDPDKEIGNLLNPRVAGQSRASAGHGE